MLDSINQTEWDLKEPQRQSLLGVVVYILRNVRAMTAILFSFLAFGAASPKAWLVFTAVIIPLGIFLFVLAYYQFRNFTFHVEDDKLIIHKRVFVKDKLVVDAERIQSIHITQNFIQRLIGLVSLKVDTAGSKGNELEIPALERVRANQLKELLYEKRSESLGEEDLAKVDDHTSVQTDKTLVSLSIKDLIVVGLTENHLRTALIALAFVFGTFSQYQEYLVSYFEDPLENYAQQAVNAGLTAMAIFIVVYAIISVLISLGRTILRFFNLKAVLNNDAVEISTGLIKRNEYRIPINKIQFIQWESNPLRKAVGFESARIKPSNSIGEVSKQQRIEIPALRIKQSALLAEGVFQNYHEPNTEVKANAWGYFRFIAILSTIISLPICGLLFTKFGFYSLFFLGLVPFIAWWGYLYGKTVSLVYDDDFIIIRKGLIFKKRIVLPTFKIQSIRKESNIFLSRRNLGHIELYTAAGNRGILYIDQDQIDRFYDQTLFAVETSNLSWM